GASSFAELDIKVLTIGSNVPPVVDAGIDKLLFLPSNSVNLIGQASDVGGSITSYLWEKISGPSATLTNATAANVTISNLVAGQYTFRLTAQDNQSATSFDEVNVTVYPGSVNQSPIADAGGNKSIALPNTSISLAGSGFDNDGSIVSYDWTQIVGPSTTITNVNSPTLLVDGLVEGVFQFRLTVFDDMGASGSSIAQVTVVGLGALLPPIANAGLDKVINLPTNSLDIQGAGSDADGTISSFNWSKKSGPAAGTLAGQATSKLSLSALEAGTYQYTLTVTDNDNLTNNDDSQVTVIQASVNKNPVVNAGNDLFIRLPDNTASITAVASDIDGSITSYLWSKQSGPTATLGPLNSATLSVNDLVLGTYIFRVEVTDNAGATSTDEVTVNVLPAGANQPPIVLAGASKTISILSTSISIFGSASDSDGSINSIQWTLEDGPNTPDLSGETTTTLTVQNFIEGLYTFRLTAIDNENTEAFDETTLEVKSTHEPPVVFAGNDTTLVLPNDFLSLTGTVMVTEGFITNYEWEQIAGPPIMLVTEYPAVSISDLLPGNYTLRFTATDNFDASGSDDLVVSVTEDKSNPVGAALIFSPNGDSTNDFWIVQNENLISGCPIKIFNNLGAQVYEADQYQNDWNGTSNGQTLKEGDYYYVFKCSSKTYSGALRLIR
ncbi:MAG: gliding motility-associated C-terminal domain-containing protein, partial [Cyclobacteriaceae bacterium]|nr:gliding motility-associated C-terminal domain-containing protein [Cyclobacteriaceae bacterium]